MRNPGLRVGEQAQGLGKEHSMTEEEAWRDEEAKTAISAAADEIAEELGFIHFKFIQI